MTSLIHFRSWTKTRGFAYGVAAFVVIMFMAANAHLIIVSFGSNPDCVLLSETKGATNYRAAKSSC